MRLQQTIEHVNKALKEQFDWAEVDKAMNEMHRKLIEPKWVIEDEALREECQKLVVQWAAQRYLTDTEIIL